MKRAPRVGRRRRWPAPLVVGTTWAVAALLGPALARGASDIGVVVEDAPAGFAGALAGMRAGDVITGWSRAANPPANPAAAEGPIESPFDLRDVEIEQAPRGPLTLIGRRGGVEMRWAVPPDEWRLQVRPSLPAGVLAPYEEGRRQLDAKELKGGIALWEKAAAQACERQDPRLAGWLLWRAAEVLTRDNERTQADDAYLRAVESLDGAGSLRDTALVLLSWGRALFLFLRLEPASQRHQRAAELIEQFRGESLLLADALDGLASVASERTSLAAGEAQHRQVLALREKLAPNSIAVADSLIALGTLAVTQKTAAAAEAYLARALRIREAAPGLVSAAALAIYARAAALRGDDAAAWQRLREALPALERQDPAGDQLANGLAMGASIAQTFFDMNTAERYSREALRLYRRLYGRDRRTARTLYTLSTIAWWRRDYASAENLGRGAREILEAVDPNGEMLALALHRLGDVAMVKGDLRSAGDHFLRALAINDALASRGVRAAEMASGMDLGCLARIRARAGRFAEAERLAARAVEIVKRGAPE